MFPLTPALSLKGEGAVCAGIILLEALSRMEEGQGEEKYPQRRTGAPFAT